MRAVLAALCVLCMTSTSNTEELSARGVNPADNDTRFDVIFKNNWLAGGSNIFTTTLKFDYRITSQLGLNIEFPVLGIFTSPSPAPGVSGLNDVGVGDLFARLRYVTQVGVSPFGSTSLGASIEAVLPTASQPTLGSGAYQLNAAGLVVQAWSPTLITAFVAKANQSVDELTGRARIQENSVRLVQAFILPRGFYATLDARYNWETINARDVWWDATAELGMMLDQRTAASIAVSRRWGDREDRGAVAVSFKRFF